LRISLTKKRKAVKKNIFFLTAFENRSMNFIMVSENL